MRCHICKADETDYRQKFEKIKEVLSQEITELEQQLLTSDEKFLSEIGITEETRKLVLAIPDEIKTSRWEDVIRQRSVFELASKNLKVLFDYCMKFPEEYFQSKAEYHFEKCSDVIERYLSEPVRPRYATNRTAIQILMGKRSELSSIYMRGFNSVSIPESGFISGISFGADSTLGREVKKEFQTRIVLCPICDHLFASASGAAHEYLQRLDDDDDDYFDQDDD